MLNLHELLRKIIERKKNYLLNIFFSIQGIQGTHRLQASKKILLYFKSNIKFVRIVIYDIQTMLLIDKIVAKKM